MHTNRVIYCHVLNGNHRLFEWLDIYSVKCRCTYILIGIGTGRRNYCSYRGRTACYSFNDCECTSNCIDFHDISVRRRVFNSVVGVVLDTDSGNSKRWQLRHCIVYIPLYHVLGELSRESCLTVPGCLFIDNVDTRNCDIVGISVRKRNSLLYTVEGVFPHLIISR